MPSMDEYASSGGYTRDSQAQVNLGGSGFSSGGGLSSPASYSGGSYTSNTPIVARPGMADGPIYTTLPIPPAVVPPVVAPVAGILGNSGNMMSIVIFGGIFVLAMSLFKG